MESQKIYKSYEPILGRIFAMIVSGFVFIIPVTLFIWLYRYLNDKPFEVFSYINIIVPFSISVIVHLLSYLEVSNLAYIIDNNKLIIIKRNKSYTFNFSSIYDVKLGLKSITKMCSIEIYIESPWYSKIYTYQYIDSNKEQAMEFFEVLSSHKNPDNRIKRFNNWIYYGLLPSIALIIVILLRVFKILNVNFENFVYSVGFLFIIFYLSYNSVYRFFKLKKINN